MPNLRPDSNPDVRIVGRYALYGKLATGGMATVHFGRLLGPVGFSRTVAIKRLHPQYAKDPEFVAMFLDEARLAARIQHPNVVATLDVVALEEELLLVMDYIRGEAFSRIMRGARKKGLEPPVTFVATILSGMLHGLHAAHEVTDERGQPLRVVHRDVSPQNVLVGVDGVPRLLDFGVAKAGARVQVTRDGQVKGKLSYMSPEQLQGLPVDRRADLFAAGVVLWEALTGKRLFLADDPQEIMRRIIELPVPPPSELNPGVPPAFDKIVMRALDKDPDARYSTAREFAVAIEHGVDLMSSREVGEWVEEIAGDVLERREQALAELESYSSVTELSPPSSPEGIQLEDFLRPALRSSGPPRPPPRKTRPPSPPVRRPLASDGDDQPATVVDTPRPVTPSPFDVTGPAIQLATVPPNQTEQELDPFGQKGRQRKAIYWVTGAAAMTVVVWLLWPQSETVSEVVNAAKSGADQGRRLGTQQPQEHAGDKSSTPSETTSPAASQASETSATPQEPAANQERYQVTAAPKPTPRPWKPAPRSYQPPVKPLAAPTAPVANACSQPWSVDAEGIRRIKPECL